MAWGWMGKLLYDHAWKEYCTLTQESYGHYSGALKATGYGIICVRKEAEALLKERMGNGATEENIQITERQLTEITQLEDSFKELLDSVRELNDMYDGDESDDD